MIPRSNKARNFWVGFCIAPPEDQDDEQDRIDDEGETI